MLLKKQKQFAYERRRRSRKIMKVQTPADEGGFAPVVEASVVIVPVWGMIISFTLWCFGKWSLANEIVFGVSLAGLFWIIIKDGDMCRMTAAYLTVCYAAAILWHHSLLPVHVPLGGLLILIGIKAVELAFSVIKHRRSQQSAD